jgi:tetratricopeptide (TPR) repeat protein
MSDMDWDSAKTLATAGVHYDLGLLAMARRQPAQAVAEYKLAVDGVGTPDPIWLVRLGDADLNAGKADDAIEAFDKVINSKDVLPQVKQVAENEKKQAQGRKK